MARPTRHRILFDGDDGAGAGKPETVLLAKGANKGRKFYLVHDDAGAGAGAGGGGGGGANREGLGSTDSSRPPGHMPDTSWDTISSFSDTDDAADASESRPPGHMPSWHSLGGPPGAMPDTSITVRGDQ